MGQIEEFLSIVAQKWKGCFETHKPDELRFILSIEISIIRLEPITARSWVLIRNKGAWKEKGTLSGAFR
jgi:hypothetical protein